MPNAARLLDPIGHSPTMNWLIKGLLIGAAVGLAAVAIVGTGGLAAVAIVGGLAAGGAGIGEVLSTMSWAGKEKTGQILGVCSLNVYINGRLAARAHVDVVECDKHPNPLPPIAEGSGNVYINSMPAARSGDHTGCGGVIMEASPNVFIGGGTQQTDTINPENLVPGWVHVALFAVGIASALILAGPFAAIIGTAGALGGGMLGGYLGGKIFGEGSDGQKWMMLGGSLLGGFAGGKGGAALDERYVITSEGLGANGGNIRIRPREIPEDGISVQDRLAQGGEPPANVRQNPDRYYYDSEAGQYKVRPEPAPDFSSGNSERAIPCFPRHTLVAAIDGFRSIERFAPGMQVASFHQHSGQAVYSEVIAVIRNVTRKLFTVQTGLTATVVTGRHRFWSTTLETWIAAQHLDVGDKLLNRAGVAVSVTDISAEPTPDQDTFNLTVADSHAYYVGEEMILVHNEDDPPNGKIYIGRNPQGDPIYVGQTKQDLLDRQAQHQTEGANDPENLGFKRDMTLDQAPGMDGLTDDQMDYHERRVYDQLQGEGADLQNKQIPLTDEKVNQLTDQYCR